MKEITNIKEYVPHVGHVAETKHAQKIGLIFFVLVFFEAHFYCFLMCFVFRRHHKQSK